MFWKTEKSYKNFCSNLNLSWQSTFHTINTQFKRISFVLYFNSFLLKIKFYFLLSHQFLMWFKPKKTHSAIWRENSIARLQNAKQSHNLLRKKKIKNNEININRHLRGFYFQKNMQPVSQPALVTFNSECHLFGFPSSFLVPL